MSLFPAEDILTKEIESWRSFAASLNSEEYTEIFNKMLSDCYRYANAINAKGETFPCDSLLMSLLLSQQKMIDWLSARVYHKQQSSWSQSWIVKIYNSWIQMLPPNFLFTYIEKSHNIPFVLISIAFILSHILQCSVQQSWRQVSFIELQAKHQISLGVVENDDMRFGIVYII